MTKIRVVFDEKFIAYPDELELEAKYEAEYTIESGILTVRLYDSKAQKAYNSPERTSSFPADVWIMVDLT